MKEFWIFGSAFVLLGILMIVFKKPFGVWFCRIGKDAWKQGKAKLPFAESVETDSFYDEKTAPSQFGCFGAVIVVQGILLILVYFVIELINRNT